MKCLVAALFCSAAVTSAQAKIVDLQSVNNGSLADALGAESIEQENTNNGAAFASGPIAFSLGTLEISLEQTRTNFTAALTGGPFAGDDLLADGLSSRNGDFVLSLLLGAGEYNFTSYHHVGGLPSSFVETLEVTIDGAAQAASTTSTGTSPASIGTFSATLVSDGINPIVLSFDASDAANINGFDLAVVPEPSTIVLALVGLSALSLVLRRRR